MKTFRPANLIEPGEKLIWSHTPATAVRPSENLEFAYKALTLAQFLFGMAALIVGVMKQPNDMLPIILISFLFFGGGVFLIKFGAKIRQWFPKHSGQLAYANCLITNRRVLLFNHLQGDLMVLNRKELSLVERDYVQGGLGLVFHSKEKDEAFAFLSTSHHGAAFQVLQGG